MLYMCISPENLLQFYNFLSVREATLKNIVNLLAPGRF